jgi:hypothetical protein
VHFRSLDGSSAERSSEALGELMARQLSDLCLALMMLTGG